MWGAFLIFLLGTNLIIFFDLAHDDIVSSRNCKKFLKSIRPGLTMVMMSSKKQSDGTERWEVYDEYLITKIDKNGLVYYTPKDGTNRTNFYDYIYKTRIEPTGYKVVLKDECDKIVEKYI